MTVIEAAGGVVWRQGAVGVEVLLVHRPLRDDWTLPIGRLQVGETVEQCALREVAEETGYRCELGAYLGTLEVDAEDGLHRFHLFAMTPVEGEFEPNPETDRVEWLRTTLASQRATYSNVRELLATFRPTSNASAG